MPESQSGQRPRLCSIRSDYITPEFTAIDAQLWTSGGIVAKTDAAWHADRSIPEGGRKEMQVRRGACMDYEPARPELIGDRRVQDPHSTRATRATR